MKNFILKKKILGICITEGSRSLADISRELNSSIPTITKLVGELIMDGYLEDMSKIDTSGGRRPSIYGLNPSAGFFAGIDINMDEVKIAVTDFKGDLVDFTTHYGFTLSNTEESFKELCRITKEFVSQIGIDTEAILAYGLSLSGRVNYQTGESFTYHLKEGGNIREFVENELKIQRSILNRFIIDTLNGPLISSQRKHQTNQRTSLRSLMKNLYILVHLALNQKHQLNISIEKMLKLLFMFLRIFNGICVVILFQIIMKDF